MSKISELSDGGALQSTDYLIAVRSGGNVKVQLSELPSGIGAGGNIVFGDNEKAIFGAGSDLQIYHDASNSYIIDNGTGSLFIRGNSQIQLQDTNTAGKFFVGTAGGAATLYHNNAAKLATTSTGIDVTGTVTADGLTVNSGATSTTVNFQNSGTAYSTLYNDTNGVVIFSADAGNTGAAPRMQFNVGGQQAFRITDGGDISFYEDTGTTPKFFWDASAEALGLGTTSPSGALDIGGQHVLYDNFDALGASFTRNGTYGSVLSLGRQGVSSGVTLDYPADNTFALSTGATERMRIDSAGRVGIGTSSPSGMLTLDKDVATLYDATDDDAQRSGTTTLAITNENGTQNTFAQIAFDLAASGQSIARIVALNDGASTSALAFVTEGSNTKREVMRLNGSGNVGIGTTSPARPLTVNGLIGSRNSTTGFGTSDGFDIGVGGSDAYLVQRENANIIIETNGAERMRIDASGNLLVGKTASANATTTVGHLLTQDGVAVHTRSGNTPLRVARTTDDGELIGFTKDGTTVGSIGVNSGVIPYFVRSAGSVGGIALGGGATKKVFPCDTTGGAADNAMDLGDTATRWKDLYLSGGVYLGGTGAANKLDDYEEGTFTPVIQGATTAGTFTYGTQSGLYTKIGNVVSVHIAINVSATSVSPVGAITVQGLPFSTSGSFQSLAVGWASGITFADQLNAYAPNSETFVVLRNSVSGSTGNQTSGSNLSSSFWLFISGAYRAT